ncbi:hypothetical protein M3Y97_00431700 [Aphelenchoides bicaudatus]|nr:hypothetical protein M3Y97_00431700 [Aphelenchoides bicaudatus]
MKSSTKALLALLTIAIACTLAANPANNVSSATRILKFLQSIPASARTEMENILKNTTLTKGQIEQQLDAWASRQPGTFPNQYKEVKDLLNSSGAKADPKAASAKVSNTAEQEIAAIRQNKSLTRLQERKAIQDIIAREPVEEDTNFAFLPDDNFEI